MNFQKAFTGSPRTTWTPGTLKLREPRLNNARISIPKFKAPKAVKGVPLSNLAKRMMR